MASVKKVKKVKRKKLNIKRLILLVLIIYLIIMLVFYIVKMPIKNIYIKNTRLLRDYEVLEISGLKNYPQMVKINPKKIENKIKTLDLVENVKVEKKLGSKLIINITEAKPLFYNRSTNKIVLSNKKEVEASSKYLGVPTLINYVPSDLLENFIKSFASIDSDIIGMINEIEYNPDVSEDIVIDKNRFLLRMNDSNLVYINIINIKRLNDYKKIIGTIGEARGTLYLDSINSNNSLFTEFESSVARRKELEKKEKESLDNNGESED